jgi:GMP synthase (glutamine-hydrolysing)
MRKLLIIKTGTTYPSIRDKTGDFDELIIAGMAVSRKRVIVASVYDGQALPAAESLAGIVITGSEAMVTDGDKWSEYTARWLRKIAAKAIPTLGICYGHQLIAHAYGGTVAYHPGGEENGTVGITLTAAGEYDPLFQVLPAAFQGHALHAQTVITLPAGARVLARNSFEPHQGFSLHGHLWGVQFHPEFTAEIVRMYFDIEQEQLVKAGYNVAELRNTVQEHPFGTRLLQRFAALTD